MIFARTKELGGRFMARNKAFPNISYDKFPAAFVYEVMESNRHKFILVA